MKKHPIIFLTSMIAFLIPFSAHAARLYFLPLHVDAQNGKEFNVELRLDTQGESINALDIGVLFSSNILAFDSFSDASSLVNIWIERPGSQEKEKEKGRVVMSGVAPGGFVGDALIAHLAFHGTAVGDARIAIAPNSKIVLDGPDGRQVAVVSNDTIIKIRDQVPNPTPESTEMLAGSGVPVVVAQLSKTPIAYEDKWFISFVSQDKNFGIKEYQVREKFLGLFGGQWKKVESPYVIEHQNLLSTIEVQAITHSDTSGEVVVIPSRLKVLYGVLIASLLSLLFISGIKRAVRGLPRVG